MWAKHGFQCFGLFWEVLPNRKKGYFKGFTGAISTEGSALGSLDLGLKASEILGETWVSGRHRQAVPLKI